VSTFGYDAYGNYPISKRLKQIITTIPGGTTIQNSSNRFDAVGNVLGVQDLVGNHTNAASGSLTNASYDDLNRLLSAGWTGLGVKTYAYDKIGNVLTNGESGTGPYAYSNNRPHFVRSANGVWFTCDQNGNVVFRGGQRLEYDVNNRLSLVLATNGILTTFGYGAGGERLWESSGTNSLQVWIGDFYEERGGKVLYHVLAGGHRVCTFEPAAGGITGYNATNQEFYYYHPDYLGSSSLMTDTGQILDEDTGLYYYNARYYDPQLGRFIQPDDIISDIGDPQSYNRYSYVLNNPLRFTDPSGHQNEELEREITRQLLEWLRNDRETRNERNLREQAEISFELAPRSRNPSRPPNPSGLPEMWGGGSQEPAPTEQAEVKPLSQTRDARLERVIQRAEQNAGELERKPAEEAQMLYRGVPDNGTQKAILGRSGVAKPRGTDLSPNALERHVLNKPVDSGVTSWTTDRDVAKRFSGSDGTIIEVNRSDVANRVVPRPPVAKYGAEKEVLLKGTVQGKPTTP